MLASVHAATMERFLLCSQATDKNVASPSYSIDFTTVQSGSSLTTISTGPEPTSCPAVLPECRWRRDQSCRARVKNKDRLRGQQDQSHDCGMRSSSVASQRLLRFLSDRPEQRRLTVPVRPRRQRMSKSIGTTRHFLENIVAGIRLSRRLGWCHSALNQRKLF